VLKPLGLSASRGVIRANNQAEFVAAFERIRALLEKNPDLRRLRQRALQVESYIEGREFAIEGLVTNGSFQPLAIFDKPDPLIGPFFEETIYVTPSREPAATQEALLDAAGARCARWVSVTDRRTWKCGGMRRVSGCSMRPRAPLGGYAQRRCGSA
jgi:biotin carboxylase